MKADMLSLSEYAVLGEIGLLIFMAVFLGAIYWMFRPGAKQAYDECARLPLDD